MCIDEMSSKIFDVDRAYWESIVNSMQTETQLGAPEDTTRKNWMIILKEAYTSGYADGHHDAIIEVKYESDRNK